MTTPLWKIDFHCHTYRSKDSLNQPRALIARAKELGLSRLVITDHNTIRGALEAQELEPEFVIVGEEVMTTRGEFLACFVSREVPRGLEPRQALDRLREQGAFVSISHPFDYQRMGWKPQDFLDIASHIDAVEIFNSRCMAQSTNQHAEQLAARHHLPGTAGSDAHSLRELGRACLELPPFSSAAELRQSIRQARVLGQLSSPFIHFTSTWARIVKRFGNKRA